MSIRLRELIRGVRACKTQAEERDAIAKECAAIRTAFKDEENPYRHRNVAKLLFIHMLGYPTHFGQMECLKLIASHKFPEKRIGYLGLMLLLDEDTEVLMLATNSLKNDLNHANQYVVGQALCAIGDIGSADICRDLGGEIEKLLTSSNAYIRKKAVLALLRIVRKCPDMVENYLEKMPTLLNDRNHGVLTGTLSLIIEICENLPETIPHFKPLNAQLVKMLKNLVLSGYAPEHDVAGITDPFLQVKILRVLRFLGNGDKEISESISDILAQVSTNTESAKNVGNAILYECVLTIVGIEADSGLRVLAVNILGRFLLNRDNNIRYVGLNTLAMLAGADIKAIQRHRTTIVECLKDPDISIRRRALDLVYLLVNESNAKPLVKELLNYLANSDVEFKEDLTSKICSVVAKHSPYKRFQADTIMQVLVIAGEYVSDQVMATLPNLISSDPQLQSFCVHTLFRAVEKDNSKPKLTQIAAWCCGEYGELLPSPCPHVEQGDPLDAVPIDRVVKLLSTLLDSSLQSSTVKQYLLTAMLKLYSRYPAMRDTIRQHLEKHSTSLVVEVQQRAVEYSLLSQIDAAFLKEITDHMPTPEDEGTNGGDGAGQVSAPSQPAQHQSGGSAMDDLLGLLDSGAPPSSAPQPAGQPEGSLIDLMGDIFNAPAQPTQPAVPAAAPAAHADPLMDLLGGGPAPAAPQPQMTPIASSPASNPTGAMNFTAYQKNGITVTFNCTKHPSNPQLSQIAATYSNSNATPVSNFTLQAAVPKHAKILPKPPSGKELPPNNSGTVTQVFQISNPMHAEKQMVMKIKLEYSLNGAPVSEMAQVDGFPAGV